MNNKQNPLNEVNKSRRKIFIGGVGDWLKSFNERHLENCRHFRVMFYDEFLDIICEGNESYEGDYSA